MAGMDRLTAAQYKFLVEKISFDRDLLIPKRRKNTAEIYARKTKWWDDMADDMAAVFPGFKRTAPQLRRKWTRMQCEAKAAYREWEKERVKTGQLPDGLSEIKKRIINLIKDQKNLSGLGDEFDSGFELGNFTPAIGPSATAEDQDELSSPKTEALEESRLESYIPETVNFQPSFSPDTGNTKVDVVYHLPDEEFPYSDFLESESEMVTLEEFLTILPAAFRDNSKYSYHFLGQTRVEMWRRLRIGDRIDLHRRPDIVARVRPI